MYVQDLVVELQLFVLVFLGERVQVFLQLAVGLVKLVLEFVHLVDVLDFDDPLKLAEVLALLLHLFEVVVLLTLDLAHERLYVVVVVLLQLGHVLQEV